MARRDSACLGRECRADVSREGRLSSDNWQTIWARESGLENLPQRRPRSVETGANRADGNAELLCDCLVIHLLNDAQREHQTLLHRQLRKGGLQLRTKFVIRRALRRIMAMAALQPEHAGRFFMLATPRVRAQQVNAAMRHRAEQPSPWVRRHLSLAPERDQALLHGVPGEVVAAENAACRGHQRGKMWTNYICKLAAARLRRALRPWPGRGVQRHRRRRARHRRQTLKTYRQSAGRHKTDSPRCRLCD